MQMFALTYRPIFRRKPCRKYKISHYFRTILLWGSKIWHWKYFPSSCSNHTNAIYDCVSRKYAQMYGGVREQVEKKCNGRTRWHCAKVDFHERNFQNSPPYSIRRVNICIWMTRGNMKIDFPPSTSYFRFMRSFKNISTDHILEISFVRTRYIFTLLYLQHLHCITFVIYERHFHRYLQSLVFYARYMFSKYTLNIIKYSQMYSKMLPFHVSCQNLKYFTMYIYITRFI